MTNICYRIIDKTMNIEELKQRAAAGEAEAYASLYAIYEAREGDGRFDEFIEFLKCAVERGDAEAPRVLADLYFAGWGDADTREILRLFALAAQRGNKSAYTGISYNVVFAKGQRSVVLLDE